MILEEIRLKDFRCFYGESSISFATDEEQNVTLIHAENGIGKTTILNALLWCFYGDTTARFEKREDIVNHDAQKEGRTMASVEVVFSHGENDYIAKRFAGSGKFYNEDRNFTVARVESGSQKSLPTPETFINTVIPKEMASHFLFDGEHAEVFLAEDNQGEIRGAVRDILGCTLIETAISDLRSVSNQFRKQMPTTAASEQIDQKNSRIETLTLQIEAAEKSLIEAEKSAETTRKQIRVIDEKLRATAAAKELQEKRDLIRQELARAKNQKTESAEDVFRWLGEHGRFIVSKEITEETFDFLDNEENRGRIPAPYNEEFVKDVLSDEKCICGADLKPGSEEAKRVASLLEKSANQTMRDRVSKVKARLGQLRTERKKAPAQLAKANRKLAEANEAHDRLEGQLAEVTEKLKGINLDDVAERMAKQEELERERSKIDRGIGQIRLQIEEANKELGSLNRDITELAKLDKKTEVFARRRELCDQIRESLEKQLEEEEDTAKQVLRARIRKILESTSRKALVLRMTDEYDISLVNADGKALPKSSGENQLLGLAFTAALVEFAKVRESAEDTRLLPGTVAPLVLDSPFGQLDPTYQETTANFIPEMARQVVLLVSKSQASTEVMRGLGDRVGAEYLLVRHNKAEQGDRKPESQVWNGKEYQTAYFDAEYDGSEIMELAHG